MWGRRTKKVGLYQVTNLSKERNLLNMFAGFNFTDVSNMTSIFNKENQDIGFSHLFRKQKMIEKSINNFVINGLIDGSKVGNDWFPQVKADIFISHSHRDENSAIALAGFLHDKFELECFIDSCVWDYSDDLLKILNDDYSNKRENPNYGYLYDYDKCNHAASHVYMMLSTAILKMIDKSEAFLLFNTSNSIGENILDYENVTFSPWIYSEIMYSELIRKKPLSDYRNSFLRHFNENAEVRNSLEVAYEVRLENLLEINSGDLHTWLNTWVNLTNSPSVKPLDILYQMKCPSKMRDVSNILRQRGYVLYG